MAEMPATPQGDQSQGRGLLLEVRRAWLVPGGSTLAPGEASLVSDVQHRHDPPRAPRSEGRILLGVLHAQSLLGLRRIRSHREAKEASRQNVNRYTASRVHPAGPTFCCSEGQRDGQISNPRIANARG